MSHGFVYVLSNPAMPDVYKVGMTERSPFKRAEELSATTAIPMPFRVAMYVAVPNMEACEREVHQVMDQCRLSRSREFFKCPACIVHDNVAYFEGVLSVWIDPDFQFEVYRSETTAQDEARADMAKMRAEQVGHPILTVVESAAQ